MAWILSLIGIFVPHINKQKGRNSGSCMQVRPNHIFHWKKWLEKRSLQVSFLIFWFISIIVMRFQPPVNEKRNGERRARSWTHSDTVCLACRVTRTKIIPEICQWLSSSPLHLTTRILMLKVPTLSPHGYLLPSFWKPQTGTKTNGSQVYLSWIPLLEKIGRILQIKYFTFCIPGW